MLELFTSQGCSSCPAADKLLGEFAADPTVIALTLSIDYWDYLGWKDTLALAGHAKRQKAYALARHDREIYTPQIVVNGMKHVLGSDKAAIERAIAATRSIAGTLSLPVSLAVTDGKIGVNVPAGAPEPANDGACRGLALPGVEVGAGDDCARREQRPHRHLSQCRAPLGQARRVDRQGRVVERPARRLGQP